MECFVIALSFGKDNICIMKKLQGLSADSIKPGTANITSISHNRDNIRKAAHLGIFHGCIISGRQPADENRNPHIWKTLLKNLDGNLIQDDLTAVIGNIYKGAGFFHILTEGLIFGFIQWILVFLFYKRKCLFLAYIRQCGKINIISGTGIEQGFF